jgi:hypothetical protein
MRERPGKVSVIEAMTDRNERKIRESVRHRGNDGQKSEEDPEKCPSLKLRAPLDGFRLVTELTERNDACHQTGQ